MAALRVARQIWYPGMDERQFTDAGRAALPAFREAYASDLTARVRQEKLRIDALRRLDAEGWQQPPVTQSLAAELARPRATIQHRIGGLAGWNHNAVIAGPRKTGKTALAVNLSGALSLSRQMPGGQWAASMFLGWLPCCMGGNVAYLNAEMDDDDWRDAFRALPAGSYDASRIYPLHRRGLPLPVITSEAARAWFVSWLREHWIEVLIIDTWGAFAAKNGIRNLNDDGEARVITDGLDAIKRETYVASIVVLTHMPHQTGERHLERFKGAGAVGDWADVLWLYVADGKGIRYLSAAGRAGIDYPETALGFSRTNGTLWLAGGDRAAQEKNLMYGRITAAVRDEPGIRAEPLKDAAGGHRNTATATIREMVSNGELKTRTEGRAIRYYLPGTSDHDSGDGDATSERSLVSDPLIGVGRIHTTKRPGGRIIVGRMVGYPSCKILDSCKVLRRGHSRRLAGSCVGLG